MNGERTTVDGWRGGKKVPEPTSSDGHGGGGCTPKGCGGDFDVILISWNWGVAGVVHTIFVEVRAVSKIFSLGNGIG